MSNKATAAEREYRRRRVAANLLAGLTYREISDALGIALGTVKRDVDAVLKRWQHEQVEAVEAYVSLQERRLDRALNAIWGDVLDGKDKAITSMLKIEKRRAELRGLDQPQEIKHSGTIEQRQSHSFEGLDDDGLDHLIANLLQE